jgi:flagellum-specific peptidoglycan hydrolase FlgJ
MRFLFLLFLMSSGWYLQAQNNAEKYISRFDSLSVEVMKSYGIPASLVLGIALHESGAGTSKLSQNKHNHFGIKGRVRSSKTKSGYVTTYRKFESDEAAYLFFGEMISKKKYYEPLKDNMDYMEWLKTMKAARYATSSTWIAHVDKVIRRYDLTRFDKPDYQQALDSPVTNDTLPAKQ